ncbi:MAG: glycogen synthase GlgA [Bradymonadaceae bacterium]|nr:glycogen synthase GlgA [Lujinxingiaceae bacterium]
MDLSKLVKTTDTRPDSAPRKLSIVFASSEVVPFSKTGGLADVAASLPKALAKRGHNVAIFTPLYKHLDPEAMRLARRLRPLEVPRRAKSQAKVECTIWEARIEGGVSVFFLENEEFFGRDGLYGYEDKNFEDNAERFAFFSRAVVEFARQLNLPVEVIHCNDWHTALAPVYKDYYYEGELDQVATVLTLHNLAYQGSFDKAAFKATGLPKRFESTDELLDEEGKVNFLKSAILHADVITAVSPTYAKEIQTEDKGFGLHDALKGRAGDLVGILNGADYSIWGPTVDRYIPVRYNIEELNGKRRNKAELQHEFGLPIRPTLPTLAMISRLTEQKGLDILIPALEELLAGFEDEQQGFQFVVLGDGNNEYTKSLERLAKRYPRRVAVNLGYSEEKAHKIQAGADMLLIPSRFEPCGLTQIYAMRYGTLPIVHATGGLADTVIDAGKDGETGSGFVFHEYTKEALIEAISRASQMYRNYRRWRPLMVSAMREDFSWATSAIQYEEAYYRALAKKEKPAKKTKKAKA